jgi:hypothetical protein
MKGMAHSLRDSRLPEARAVVSEHLSEEISSITEVVRPTFVVVFDGHRGRMLPPDTALRSYAVWPARRDKRVQEEPAI